MQEGTTTTVAFPSLTFEDVLTGILQEGAQRMLAAAIDAEVSDWIDSHAHLEDGNGHRQVVRNGYLPERNITTGLGDIPGHVPGQVSESNRMSRQGPGSLADVL